MLQMNDPPTRLKASADIPVPRTAFHEITRGDLRLSGKKASTEARLWFYIHHHPDQILEVVRNSHIDTATILTELLLLMNLLHILDESLLKTINHILPMINANVQMARIEGLVKQAIQRLKQKFEDHLKQEV